MTRISLTTVTILAASGLMLAACSREADAPPADNGDMAMTNDMMAGNDMSANATAGAPQSFAITGADGASLGSVALAEDAAGLTMNVTASGMPAGVHGIHLHEKGLCEGPKFASAGAHWNPGMKKHGRDNPAGAHFGDLANLDVAANGTASVSIPLQGAMMASGAMMLADADGTALVVHAKPDDYKTDPSGDSGDRIACAVVAGGR